MYHAPSNKKGLNMNSNLLILLGALVFMVPMVSGASDSDIETSDHSIRYVCSNAPASEQLSIVQFQRDGRLAEVQIRENGIITRGHVMGANTFPVGSRVGDALYGTPPHTQFRFRLLTELKDSENFQIRLIDLKKQRSIDLNCNLI
jgi:hypothetical protein